MLQKFFKEGLIEAGCDEAGRGCLAGPVVAAAVILPPDFENDLLNDSKLLTKEERNELRPIIEESATCYSIGIVDPAEIDEINILNASFRAMQRAIDQLTVTPQLLLIDGNRYRPHNETPFECIIKGDGKMLSIAAASVLAKTYRDALMCDYARQYPGYSWETNYGYGTIHHRRAIKDLGVTPLHRMSFKLLPDQLDLFQDPEAGQA